MKRIGYMILSAGILLSSLTALTSCTIETSGNGNLDGYWHMVRVDTISTGGTCDLSEKLVFWAIQGTLINTVDRSSSGNGYIMHFGNADGSLRLYDIYVHDRANGDIKVEDPAVLSPFGINALEETFVIESLGKSSMILATDRLRLSFRKL